MSLSLSSRLSTALSAQLSTALILVGKCRRASLVSRARIRTNLRANGHLRRRRNNEKDAATVDDLFVDVWRFDVCVALFEVSLAVREYSNAK